MNRDLVRAIQDKRLIEFVYRIGPSRIVEPHDYGIRRVVASARLSDQWCESHWCGAWMERVRRRGDSRVARAGTSVRRNKGRQCAAPSNMGHALRPRQLIRLELRAAFATRSPEGADDDLAVVECVVEVESDSSQINAA